MKKFTPAEIEVYTKFGFILNEDKHSGFPYKDVEDSNYGEVYVLVKQDVGYKLECHGTYPDGDGGYDADYARTYSEPSQTLEQFLTAEI